MIKIYKPNFWSSDYINFFSLLLFPVSFVFQILIYIKDKFTKQNKFNLPVICIGNIYLGGTGKTPLAMKIATILRKLDKKPAIVRKFYSNQNDENFLINKRSLNLITRKSRGEAILEAEINNYDSVILDDGFQDVSVKKDLSILCFHSKQMFGNGHTIPSGPLRESLNAIKGAQIIVINGERNEDFEHKIRRINKNIDIYYSRYLPVNIKDFKNSNLLAFAGIGNPKNFFNLLIENNMNVIKSLSFPDHYNYTKKDLQNIRQLSEDNNLKIITTEKDFCRINSSELGKIKHLSLDLEIINEEKFIKKIQNYL